jgi:hypothetical protein
MILEQIGIWNIALVPLINVIYTLEPAYRPIIILAASLEVQSNK